MSLVTFGQWVRQTLVEASPVVDGEIVPVLHENTAADGYENQPHYHLTIRSGLSSPTAQGPTAERRFEGAVQIACRVPKEVGPDIAERMVDAIDATFNRVTVNLSDGDRVIFRDGGEEFRQTTGPWFQINWVVPFQREVASA